jgi:hypothetical protein
MEKQEVNYEKDIQIDENSLDIECLDQSSLMLKYGQYEAKMERKKADAEEALDYVVGQIDLDIRKNPEKHGLKDIKITEAVIKNVIIQKDDYKKARDKLFDAKEEHTTSKNVVKAVSQRKDMLEGLIYLHGQQYFSSPSVPRDLNKERAQKKQAQEEVNNGISKKIRKRRRE